MNISNNEYKKFSKQIILKKFGIIGQKKIKSSKVLIFGMGGLGCPLSIYLASSGVGTIGIVDYDKVELSNLNRQIIFNSQDIGKYKVDQARYSINRINNKIKIKIFKKKITLKNIESIIKDFEIICDGTDNFDARYLINDKCKKMKKILISAAISKFDGHLYKFNFKKKGSCYRCFMPDKPILERNCETEGIFSPVAGILGSLQANEVLKTIIGFKNSLDNQMMIFDSIKINLRKVKLSFNPHCINKC